MLREKHMGGRILVNSEESRDRPDSKEERTAWKE